MPDSLEILYDLAFANARLTGSNSSSSGEFSSKFGEDSDFEDEIFEFLNARKFLG